MNRSREEEEDHIVNHLRPHPKCHCFLLASGHFRVPHLHTFAPTTPHTPTQSATFWKDSVVECFLDADIACTADSRRQTLRFQKAASCKLQVGNRFTNFVLSISEIVDFASHGDDCWERGGSERKKVLHGCVENGIFEGTVGREGAGIGGFFWSWSHMGFFFSKIRAKAT